MADQIFRMNGNKSISDNSSLVQISFFTTFGETLCSLATTS